MQSQILAQRPAALDLRLGRRHHDRTARSRPRRTKVTVKTRLGTRWHSIERQLPLLIAGLLLVTVFAFAWGAYQRVKHVLLTAAGQRLQSTSVTLDLLFAEAARRYVRGVDSAGSDPAVATFLTTGHASPDLRRRIANAWNG